MCYRSAPRGRSPSPPVLLCLGSRKVPGSCHQVENGKFSPPYLGSLCPALLSPPPMSRCSLSELPNAFFFFFPSAKESLPSPRRDPAALWTRRRFSVVGFLGSWDGICLPWSSHRVGKGETRESPQSSKKKKPKLRKVLVLAEEKCLKLTHCITDDTKILLIFFFFNQRESPGSQLFPFPFFPNLSSWGEAHF